jgi:hypothetical protein
VGEPVLSAALEQDAAGFHGPVDVKLKVLDGTTAPDVVARVAVKTTTWVATTVAGAEDVRVAVAVAGLTT